MIDFGTKAASEVVLFTWEPELATADAIATIAIAAISPATITISDETATDSAVTFRAAGGATGEIAYISLSTETDAGDTITDVGRLVIVAHSPGEIITAGELRAELRDCADADSVLLNLITDAREFVEAETGRATIAREVVQVMDAWPGGELNEWWDGVRDGAISADAPNFVELNIRPAISITTIETLNESGVAATWANSNYVLDNLGDVHRIVLKPGSSWPIVGLPAGGIRITYQAGYADPSLVPGMFKRAVRQIASHWYENRELASADAANKIPMMAAHIIKNLKERRL